ncbi:MAG TPA: alpha/beta hydrolase [Rhizomicrobium sp.]|nr:alpha/beta hydrolase [Rhizomicrobium sp.]
MFGAKPETRGVCAPLHGQTEFIEKYGEVIGELNARGYTVATFDWRGQGGSQRPLEDPLKSYVKDFAQFDDDLTSFLEQIVKPMSDTPPIALAHSMGAHILLRTLHDKPSAFRAAALSAPMIAVSTRGYPEWLARTVTALYNGFGQGGSFAWGMADRDPFKIDFNNQLVTSDQTRFQHTQDFLKAHPDLRLAGPTWGWLEAAYKSMARVSAPGFAEAIPMPVLIAGPGKDRICKTSATEAFAARMPNGEYLDLPDSEHEILMENDSIRARFWSAFDAFTAKLG